MKREVFISGKLLYPLLRGEVALILRKGEIIRTSPVVKIREENDGYALFETQNSVYRVSIKPAENKARAVLPSFLMMCA